MKLHRNAKSTPASRLLHGAAGSVTKAGLSGGGGGVCVSVRTVAKWVRRFREGGVAGLEDASSRPGPPPHQTPPRGRRADPVAARAARVAGVGDWAGAPHPALDGQCLAAATRPDRARPRRRPSRCSATNGRRPGDLLHVDIKPLGRIGCVGHRIHGDRRRATPGIGWEYVHVAIDDHSRIAYVEVLARSARHQVRRRFSGGR